MEDRRAGIASILVITAFLALPRQPLQAAPQWKRLESANFEMFTATGEGRARELLDHFERVRQFFLESSGQKTISSLPVRIIVLNSDKEWEKYRVSETAAAFFKAGVTRDFIVMNGASDLILQIATHEFIHLIVRHSGSELPIWLNEGLAELYSSLRAEGDKVRVGAVLEGRAYALARGKWLPLPELFAVDHDSPHYTEKDRAGIFYAQSWLLTHMLYLSDALRLKAGAFIGAIAAGKSAEEAFRSVYGLQLAQVDWQLHDYYEGQRVHNALFSIKLPKKLDKAEAVPATPAQQASCQGLMLAMLKKRAESMELLERLARENPGDLEVAEAITEAAWMTGDSGKGALYSEQALKLGSRNPALQWRYAEHLAAQDLTSDRLPALAREVIQRDPANFEARLLLLDALVARQEYGAALLEARPVKNVEPKYATRFFAAASTAHWLSGQKDEARQELERAKKYATDPRDQQRCEELERFFERHEEVAQARQAGEMARAQAKAARIPEPPPEPVEPQLPARGPSESERKEWTRRQITGGDGLASASGSLAALQCTGQTAVLILKDEGGHYLRLFIDDPKKVILEGSDSDSFEFTCGAQKPVAMEVEYRRDSAIKENGVLRVLRFVKQP